MGIARLGLVRRGSSLTAVPQKTTLRFASMDAWQDAHQCLSSHRGEAAARKGRFVTPYENCPSGLWIVGGPGRAANYFSELGCLVNVGDDDRSAFADETMASRGCRARDGAGNRAQRPAQRDRVTGDVEGA